MPLSTLPQSDPAGVQKIDPLSNPILAGLNSNIDDVTAVLLSEVATSDLSKLGRILNPVRESIDSSVLETLFNRAVEEVLNGNPERAVGYLADYATRNPNGAEILPTIPELAPIRNQIDSMVGRMTLVAKMSAEDQLSRAEQAATRGPAKLSGWETSPNVILKIAQRIFESGGYANYSRTSELGRVLISSATEAQHALQAMAASASANSASLLQGSNAPYWAAPEPPLTSSPGIRQVNSSSRYLSTPTTDLMENLAEFRQIGKGALRQMWHRAPLLVMLMGWSCLGAWAGGIFAVLTYLFPHGFSASAGNLLFDVWALGLLLMGLVGLGLHWRARGK